MHCGSPRHRHTLIWKSFSGRSSTPSSKGRSVEHSIWQRWKEMGRKSNLVALLCKQRGGKNAFGSTPGWDTIMEHFEHGFILLGHWISFNKKCSTTITPTGTKATWLLEQKYQRSLEKNYDILAANLLAVIPIVNMVSKTRLTLYALFSVEVLCSVYSCLNMHSDSVTRIIWDFWIYPDRWCKKLVFRLERES